MKRIEFIKTCGIGCLGVIVGGIMLSSCSPTVYLQKTVSNDQIRLSLSEFFIEGQTEKFKRYVLVKADSLHYPIVVYRKSDTEFHALLLRCTHKGTQLNVHGDLISCPAHGSEFSNKGEVISSPAPTPLKSFESMVIQDELVIKLS